MSRAPSDSVVPVVREPPVLVGLMSGTSCDGISAAVVRFAEHADGRATPTLLGFAQPSYDATQRARLLAAMTGAASPDELTRLDFDVGGWLADAAMLALRVAGVSPAAVSAVASHGHTVWHAPPHATWQFGQPAVIAERTGLPVIADFRVRDVAAGGQGAPLVPLADALCYSDATAWRALQNVGGIGNVTVVPPGGALHGVTGFDTGPGVAVIDGVVQRVRPELRFDVDGALAQAGQAVPEVLAHALADPYFAQQPPRSTGRERFTPAYIDAFIAACRAQRPQATPQDLVATATALTVESIADAYRRFVPAVVTDVLVSGGGARNPALMDGLRTRLVGRTVRPFDAVFGDGEAKEAVAFAFLGLRFLRGMPGNVPHATGAAGPRVLGALYPA